MSTYNFKRVRLDVLTVHDIGTKLGLGHMIRDLLDPFSLDSQLVTGTVTDRSDLLECLSYNNTPTPPNVMGQTGFGAPGKHLEHACVAMGMELDDPA